MRPSLLFMIPAVLLALVGCEGERTATVTEGETVARVNGEAVTETRLLHYALQRTGGDMSALDPEVLQQLLNELINIELLAQSARADKLDEQSPLRERLAFQRDTAMADAAMSQFLEENPVTDEQVRAEYEQRKGELGGTEYKARHILVEEEDTARQLIAQLEEGGDFEALAKEHSIEPGAANSGGDLGWFSPQQMVPPFAAAVRAMSPGERSDEPVQTQFGWHVISVEDSREVEAPGFEEVSEQIRRFLTNQRIQNYISELRANAEITETDAPAANAMTN